MPDTYAKNMVYLSEAQYQELISNNSITVNGQTITYSDDDIYVTPQPRPILDVQINGSSIKSGETANIPIASANNAGVVTVESGVGGLDITNGLLQISRANTTHTKLGSSAFRPITPYEQHNSVFYGLAKASGDTTQSQSSNAVGQYTDEAKASIQRMLGVTDLVAAEESSTATAAHVINSTFMMDGKLYRATSAIAVGDAVVEGQNCEVVKIEDVYATKKDTVLETTLSRGRKEGTTVGSQSFAFGLQVESSGLRGFGIGAATVASGSNSFAEGVLSIASGATAHSEGTYTIANGTNTHAEGTYNQEFVLYPVWEANKDYYIGDIVRINSNSYICIENCNDSTWINNHWKYINQNSYMALIVGNGNANDARSNAYALDWNGNGHFMGDVYVGANADSSGGTKLIKATDYATGNTAGVVKVLDSGAGGIQIVQGQLSTKTATSDEIKDGTNLRKPITPGMQSYSTFYGLAKAAGDTSQSSSNNAVGTYTAGAKTAIKQMIGINVEDVQVNSTSVVSNGIANINLSNYATTTDTTSMDARITALEAEITSLRQALQSMLTPANAILTENNDVLTDEQGNPIESDVSSGG